MKRAAAFGVLVSALTACAELTGVSDLRIGEKAPIDEPPPVDPPDEDGGAVIDAGVVPDTVVAPPPTDAGADADAGADTAPPPCTALPTNETFPAAPGAQWSLLGSAAAAMPGVVLTPNTMGVAGALWWTTAATFDRFEIAFSYVITQDPASTTYGPGDGLAFAWVDSTAPPALGPTGGSLAIRGLVGFAVAVDTYTNTEYMDQPAPSIAIKNTVDMTNIASTAANTTLHDGKAHAVVVRLANGAVTVSLDGTVALGPTTLPNYVPYSGYWGFGAACGGAFEKHDLKSVTARIGTTGACAAPP